MMIMKLCNIHGRRNMLEFQSKGPLNRPPGRCTSSGALAEAGANGYRQASNPISNRKACVLFLSAFALRRIA
jgi:hypothetical protein